VTYTKEQIPVPTCWPDNEAVREDIYPYYSSVRRLDETVGAVLRAIESSGQAQNTLIVFLADQGIGREFAKWSLYPQGTRTPMIVRWPGVVDAGKRDAESVISAIDVAPTFLEAAGVQPPEFMDGRSILNVMSGRADRSERRMTFSSFDYMNNYPDRDAQFATYTPDLFDQFDNYRPMRAIHSSRYTYIWNAWANGRNRMPMETSSGDSIRKILRATGHADRAEFEALRTREEFYDINADPGCLKNLIDDPALADTVAGFRAELLKVMQRTNDQELANYRKLLQKAG
jgi:N-sulfoglucosamine sulfohydrolase